MIPDILMPGRDGLDIIQTIRKENPAVKIIAVSGGGDTGRIDYLPQAEDFGGIQNDEETVSARGIAGGY